MRNVFWGCLAVVGALAGFIVGVIAIITGLSLLISGWAGLFS